MISKEISKGEHKHMNSNQYTPLPQRSSYDPVNTEQLANHKSVSLLFTRSFPAH